MKHAAEDDGAGRAYLLGTLEPEALEALEQQIFADEELFWRRLCVVEDELVDEYVRGTLDSREREAFERFYLCTDERRGKVEFARALQAYVARAPELGSTRQPWFFRRVSAPTWAAAAAAIVLLAGPATIVWFSPYLTNTGEAVVTGTLTSGVTRAGGGELTRLQLSPSARVLQLRLMLGADQFAAHRATLHGVDGDQVLSLDRLAPTGTGARRAITINLPAELLPEGDYFVRLYGLSPGTEPVVLDRYDFRVLRD